MSASGRASKISGRARRAGRSPATPQAKIVIAAAATIAVACGGRARSADRCGRDRVRHEQCRRHVANRPMTVTAG
jgi:hypothetical protein